MNVRQVAFLLFASVGLLSFNTVQAQQVSIKGPKNASAQMSGNTYGPITPTDTLWRIASRYRNNDEFSIYQVMQAIYELNPTAFENQNFNYLVDGAILNLPSERFIARINPQQAEQKAERDEAIWQAAGGKVLAVVPQPTEQDNVASKKDLTDTKQVIEDRLTRLDAEQNRQFSAIRQQFAESITSVQSLLDENRKLIDRLDGVDQEITNLRGRVDDEIQIQMDQMLALQNELLAISKQAEQQRQAEQEKDNFAWLTDPIFLMALMGLLTISLLGYFAMWMMRRSRAASDSQADQGDFDSPVLEQSDEMDDLADALTDELSNGLDDDDDDLFGDDDLLDDVLSDELQESLDDALDEEFETFDDLDEDSLDPVIEEATDALDEEGDGLLAQDDLDSLFDEEEGLLAEVDDDLDNLDQDDNFDVSDAADQELSNLLDNDDEELLASEPDPLAEAEQELANDFEDDDAMSADEIIEAEQQTASSEPQSDTLAEADTEAEGVPDEVNESQQSSVDEASESGPKPLVDDEQDKPEISIDELLEQPEKELPEVVQEADSQELDEEMLQNLDREIESQNKQLDEISDELLTEIDQLEQMGGMLDGLDDTEEDEDTLESNSSGNAETQHSIQELDSVSEGIEDDLDDNVEDDIIEEVQDIADEPVEDDSIEEESIHEESTDTESGGPQSESEAQPNAPDVTDDEHQSVDIDALLDENFAEAVSEDNSEEQVSENAVQSNSEIEEKSANELLAELEAKQSQVTDTQEGQRDPKSTEGELDVDVEQDAGGDDPMPDEDTDEEPAKEQDDSELDQALQDFEAEFGESEDEITDTAEESRVGPDVDDDLPAVDDDLSALELETEDSSAPDDPDLPEIDDSLLDEVESLDSPEAVLPEVDVSDSDVQADSIEQIEEDEAMPSLDDYDSLTDDSSDFDDADLEEALKAFDEDLPDVDQQDAKDEPLADNSVELDDLPGLGDWLSESEKEENSAIDELENTSFEEILDSIEDEDEEEIIEQQLSPDNPDLDIDALLSDADIEHSEAAHSDKASDSESDTSDEVADAGEDEDDFLDVDALLNESFDEDTPSAAEKDLDLASALESYKGIGESDMIDVDSDNGIGAKLDLAQAYIETDDLDAAKALLAEVVKQGDAEQQAEAQALLDGLEKE